MLTSKDQMHGYHENEWMFMERTGRMFLVTEGRRCEVGMDTVACVV